MSESAKIIETIFNNRLRKIAVKEAMNTPLLCRSDENSFLLNVFQHRSVLKDMASDYTEMMVAHILTLGSCGAGNTPTRYQC
jgi:hypothetical protein